MMMIDQEIKQAFDAISLLLVFVTVFFDMKYKVIQVDLKKEIPTGDKAKKHFREELIQSLLINCGFLVIVTGAICYMFTPTLIKLVSKAGFNLWNFDFIRTAFVAISIFTFIFFLWSLDLSRRLIRRIQAINRK
jgi:hypothetical protein